MVRCETPPRVSVVKELGIVAGLFAAMSVLCAWLGHVENLCVYFGLGVVLLLLFSGGFVYGTMIDRDSMAGVLCAVMLAYGAGCILYVWLMKVECRFAYYGLAASLFCVFAVGIMHGVITSSENKVITEEEQNESAPLLV